MICPRRLAIFAYLKMIGACNAVNPILDTDYEPLPSECARIIGWVACSFVVSQVAEAALRRLPRDKRAGFTLDALEALMWVHHDDRASPSERGILSSLYFETPPMGNDGIPF